MIKLRDAATRDEIAISCILRNRKILVQARPSVMRKQLDHRIPTLIDNNVKKNHRSFIILVGDKGRDQVPSFYIYACSKVLKTPFIDCKFTFLIISSKSFSSAFCIMVL